MTHHSSNSSLQNIASVLFTLLIITSALFILQRFILPLAWASVIAVVTWPVYRWWWQCCRQRDTLAALSLTTVVTLIIVIPISWLLTVIVQETQMLANFLMTANKTGLPTPDWLIHVPGISHYLVHAWEKYLAKPQGVSQLISVSHAIMMPASHVLKIIGVEVFHRGVTLGFTILSLFFFYQDGIFLAKGVKNLGAYLLGKRWDLYEHKFPQALKAILSGSVLVGFSVGLFMGVIYAILNLPAPALLGLITAVLSMIPYLVIIAYLIASLILLIQGKLMAMIGLLVIGLLVSFIADHFVRPLLIRSAIRLPFLVVLFGILGGVETMGLIGLFIGPTIMTLVMMVCLEPQDHL
ncbi:MAG: AI-2E family transporter [Legionellales bacterium]|nr:AI-2E family transporter [Legionellales bacterium]